MKLSVAYHCRKKLTFDSTPDFITKAAELWMAYNKQMIKGFASEAAEEKARKIASQNDGEVLASIVWEVDTSWLSEPKLVKPFSLIKEPKPGEVSFEFDSEGNITLDADISVVLETKKSVSEDDLDEWASDNSLQDIFMLTVKCDSDSDVLEDDYSMNLAVKK